MSPRAAEMWFLGIVLFVTVGAASAATITTLDVDFESPIFAVGDISSDPNATGQGGWGGYNSVLINNQLVRARITDEQAHSGTQSLRTTSDTRTINKALDPSQGEYPFAGFFSINGALDWWVQAWVLINPGASVTMTLSNALGGCPLIQISTTGVPYVNSCIAHDPNQSSLGSGIFGQWVLFQMDHTASMGQALNFSIVGAGIDWHDTLSSYSGPGSGSPQYLGLSGDAYWDDVSAGYGPVPGAVPIPGAAWLFGSGLLGLMGVARRGSARLARSNNS